MVRACLAAAWRAFADCSPFRGAVFNLVSRTDVAATEAKLSAYAAANAESITANRVRKARRVQATSAYHPRLTRASRACTGGRGARQHDGGGGR